MSKSMILVFGPLEFDGRAIRVANIVGDRMTTLVVDQGEGTGVAVPGHFSRERVPYGVANKYLRHLLVWVALIVAGYRYKPDYIVAENYFMLLPAYVISRLTGARLIYDAYELIIPEPGLPMSRRDRLWYGIEKLCIKSAILVVAANGFRAKKMLEHYQLAAMPVSFANIPDVKKITLDSQVLERFPALCKAEGKDRLILYQGAMDLNRGLARFISAMVALPASYRLILVGSGNDLGALAAHIKELHLEDRVFQFGIVESSYLFNIVKRCDLGIVTYPFVGLNNIYCAPNKIFEYTQAGIPVIATDQPPIKEMVEAFGVGGLIGPDEPPAAIAAKILMICNDWSTYANRIPAFVAHFTYENEAKGMINGLDSAGVGSDLGNQGPKSEPSYG